MPLDNEKVESEANTLATVKRFNNSINHSDREQIVDSLTVDTIFENTYPAPDGTLYEGLEVVRYFWEAFFSASQHARFEIEETITAGNRCVVRWKYFWTDENGESTPTYAALISSGYEEGKSQRSYPTLRDRYYPKLVELSSRRRSSGFFSLETIRLQGHRDILAW
jgi:nuclear transport factor 2 (NTF2) superfamily protein